MKSLHERTLFSRYVCIYLDATYISLKSDMVQKEAVYIAIGVLEDGTKKVVSYFVSPTESASMWKELLITIKERGVEEVLLFITDGITGLPDYIAEVYPESIFQTCCINVSRNIAHKVRVSDRKEVSVDFKLVYSSPNAQAAQKAICDFVDKWNKNYPKVTEMVNSHQHLITFYDFFEPIWRSIYFTNLIEGFNKQIKCFTKRKEQFENEDSLECFLVSRFEEYNHRFASDCYRSFKEV